jgi:hypothetical protein
VRRGEEQPAAAPDFPPCGWKPNFCPPTLASRMRPPFARVNTATPFWYFALAAAPDLIATALTCAEPARSKVVLRALERAAPADLPSRDAVAGRISARERRLGPGPGAPNRMRAGTRAEW